MDAVYQDQILAYAKAARALPPIIAPDASATMSNPICGDRVEVQLQCNADGVISAVSVAVRGCALCEAGAGLLASIAPGTSSASLTEMRGELAAFLAGETANPCPAEIEKFMPVRAIRNRHKCVLLPFEAAVKALDELV